MSKKCHSMQGKCKQQQHSNNICNNCMAHTFPHNYPHHGDQRQRQQQQDIISRNVIIIEFCKKVFRKCFFLSATDESSGTVSFDLLWKGSSCIALLVKWQ